MFTEYVSREHMLDRLAVKDGEIEKLKQQIVKLTSKLTSSSST